MTKKPYAVWSLPSNRMPQFLGDAESLEDAFKFKAGMQMVGHVDVKVFEVSTGAEVEVAPEEEQRMRKQTLRNFDKVRIKDSKQEGVIVETRSQDGIPTLYSVQIGNDATARSWKKPQELEPLDQ